LPTLAKPELGEQSPSSRVAPQAAPLVFAELPDANEVRLRCSPSILAAAVTRWWTDRFLQIAIAIISISRHWRGQSPSLPLTGTSAVTDAQRQQAHAMTASRTKIETITMIANPLSPPPQPGILTGDHAN
jgi:hypothetical protein